MKKTTVKEVVKTSIIAERISTLNKQATPLVTKVMNLKIREQSDYQACAAALAKIKAIRKIGQEEKEEFTKPLNALLKATNAHFKPFFDYLDNTEEIKKGEMVIFLNEQEVKAEKIQAKFNSGEIKKVSTLLGKQAELQTTSEDANVRRLNVVEIVDEKKIPREYLVPDMVRIKAALLAGESVPGAKIVEKKSIAI